MATKKTTTKKATAKKPTAKKLDEIFEVKPNPACLPIPGNGKGDTERWEQLFRGEL